MKIRIIQKVQEGETFHMPGDLLDVDKEQAAKWINEGVAVAWEEEQPKKKKAVSDGDR